MKAELEKVKGLMADKGLDALWITSAENHRWLCGFNNPDGWLLITKNKSYVFADFRYIEAARAQSDPAFEVIMPSGAYLAPLVDENGVKTIGFENNRMTVAAFERLKKTLPDCSFEPIDGMLTDARSIKTQYEVEQIVAAQRIAEAAFEHILKYIKYDMTETEVALELEYFMRKNGAEDKSFDTICVSGTASALPHGVPRHKKLERGFLTMDYGAVINGYHSDMTRTVVIGKADDEMKKLYSTVLSAQRAAIDAITEGAKNAEMDKIARDIIDGAGYAGCFGHSLGHGVGLEIHEAPGLSGGMGDAALKVGQVITVEPGIYIEGKYGCRIEDMVEIIPGGKRDLTLADKELIEL